MRGFKQFLPSATQILLLVVTLVAIAGSGRLLPVINNKRAEYQLTQNQPLENAPPQLVLATTALGGLRGLIIDYLWLRATELRNKGSHYEIIQLYDWIGKLEPRLASVWSYISWEMAYNISITMDQPKERWRWIYKGIEQLRDYGLRYNQRSLRLYRELTQIINDKIEMNSVAMYRYYYQIKWFSLWQGVLGVDPDWQALAQTPTTLHTLLQQDEKIAEMIKLWQAERIDIFTAFFAREELTEKQRQSIDRVLSAPEYHDTAAKLITYIRAKRIRDEFKMDPKKMYALIQQYGDMDWRLASSHVVYWSSQGLASVKGREQYESEVAIKILERYVYLGLKQNFEYGKVIGVTPYRVVCIPNFAVLDALHQLFEKTQKEWELEQGTDSHKAFLEEVVKKCYLYNQRARAQKYFKILRQKFNDPKTQTDLDNYVITMIGYTVNFGRRHIIEDYMIRSLAEAYANLINGVSDRHEGLSLLVTQIYKRYQERHAVGPANDEKNPFEEIRPFSYFQRMAAKFVKKSIIQQKGQAFWEQVAKNFPQLAKLAED